MLDQVHALDDQVGAAVERYNLANIQLDQIDADLTTNARHLGIAKSSLRNARSHLASRLVAIYTGGEDASAVEVLLGAASLQDLTDRLDTMERVGSQDARIVHRVRAFKHEVQARKLRLQRARVRQREIVAQRAAEKQSIENQLAERQQMLASIKDQIAQLQAEERAREARLAEQARARLAQQRALTAQVQSSRGAAAIAAPEIAVVGGESEAVSGTAAPPSRYGGVVGIAMQYLGTPYVWGGATPGGFDCSGFAMYVYAQVGVSLPHNAAMQYGMGVPVSRSDLQAGDLVFFNGLGHMGIYVGGGSFIHAPHTGDVVKISSLNDSWYASTYVGARRIL